MLSENQKQRYLRNLLLPEIGEDGQLKLLQSRVLVIGAGGLGSAVIFYLAAAGIGKIAVVDDDVVEISNLQRQIIHNLNDLGVAKVVSVKEKIALLNPEIIIESYCLKIDKQNLVDLVENYDWVVDASDNFATRFAINAVCYQKNKPLIFAAVKGFLAQISVFKSYLKESPCYCCFNPNQEQVNCELPLSEKGILGAVAGMAGCLQAANLIKEILSLGESLVGYILIFDLIKNDFHKVKLNKNENCLVCCDNYTKP